MDVAVGLLQRHLVEKELSAWLNETPSAELHKDLTVLSKRYRTCVVIFARYAFFDPSEERRVSTLKS